MKWRKLGQVYSASGEHGWQHQGAMVPTTLLLDSETIRVFVAFQDGDRVGRVGCVDVAAAEPTRVLRVSERPVLDIGTPGAFDDHGVNPLSVVEVDGRVLLYYAGWQLGVAVRYFLFEGLAISDDRGESFRRLSRTPVLERSDSELLVRSSGHVRNWDGVWRMWYAGGDRFVDDGDKERPSYPLRYLESEDGVHWGRSGRICIEFADDDEYGFGRPAVVRSNDGYRMWYSIRTHSKIYRIGYAESPDGIEWKRLDHLAGIDVADEGWDSEMVCYPCIQETEHGTYLFYNGNGYGASGFGVAVAEDR